MMKTKRLMLLSASIILFGHLLFGCGGAFRRAYNSRMEAPPPLPTTAPGGVSITWMGTAGLYVTDGTTAILIDPFVSRYGMLKVGFCCSVHPDTALIDKWIKKLNMQNVKYVFVSHSHFDHSLDAPEFAKRLGATLVGSESTANIGRGQGMPETALLVPGGAPVTAGGFRIRLIESHHRKLFWRIPYPGVIEKPLPANSSACDYKLGVPYAILVETKYGSFLHHPSVPTDPEKLAGVKADVLFMSLAGMDDEERFLKEVVDSVGAKILIPTHFDNFFKPLENPIEEITVTDLSEFIVDTKRLRPELKVITLPIGEPVRLF